MAKPEGAFSAEVAEAMSARHGSLTIDEMVARMRDAGYREWEIADEVDEAVWAKSRSESREAITAEQIAARADDSARTRIPSETMADMAAGALIAERPEPTMTRVSHGKPEAHRSAEGVAHAPARLLAPPLLAHLASEVEESSEGMAFVEDARDLYERGFSHLDVDDMLGYLESCGDGRLGSCIAADAAGDPLITAFSDLPAALALHEAPSPHRERGRQAGKDAPKAARTVAGVAKQARERAKAEKAGSRREKHGQNPIKTKQRRQA